MKKRLIVVICDACGAKVETEETLLGPGGYPDRWGMLHIYQGSDVPGGDLCDRCLRKAWDAVTK